MMWDRTATGGLVLQGIVYLDFMARFGWVMTDG